MNEIWFFHDHQESPYLRRHYLELAGFRVRTFSTGDNCAHALQRRHPSLLLLDVLLDGRNGFEVCRAVRAHVDATLLPVILGSHIYLDPIHEREALDAGAQAYLHLPIGPDELIRAVQGVLDEAAKACRAA